MRAKLCVCIALLFRLQSHCKLSGEQMGVGWILGNALAREARALVSTLSPRRAAKPPNANVLSSSHHQRQDESQTKG